MLKQLKFPTIILFLFVSFSMFGQNKEMTVHLYGGLSAGLGDFAKKIGDRIEVTRISGLAFGKEIGLASTGFVLGTEITFPVLFEGFGWQLSIKSVVNPTSKDEIEASFNKDKLVVKQLSIETGDWINIPMFTGFNYGYKINEAINIYGHLQAGLNLTQQAQRKVTFDGTVVEDTEYRMMIDFGLETGISLELFDKYVLSARYLNLGSPRYEGTRKLNEKLFTEIPKRDFIIEAEEKPVSMLLIALGIKF